MWLSALLCICVRILSQNEVHAASQVSINDDMIALWYFAKEKCEVEIVNGVVDTMIVDWWCGRSEYSMWRHILMIADVAIW